MLKYIDSLFITFDNKYTVLIFYTIITLIIGKILIYILNQDRLLVF